jgi:hypothetical protein
MSGEREASVSNAEPLTRRAWWLAGLMLFLAVVSASLQSCAMKPAGTHGKLEPDPIPLDSRDLRYSGYLAQVQKMIKEKWGYPCVKDANVTARCDYKSAQLVIVFDILKSRRVSQVQVQETSGYKIYDDYAANAVRLASPFRPLPSEIRDMMASVGAGNSGIRIIAAFKYKFVEHEGHQ